ncbi:MAG: hypothetical protein ACM3VV_00780 [Deltaproteobacteria bacterium]
MLIPNINISIESNHLKRLKNTLFKILINICDSTNNKKYEVLTKFLVRRITIWKPKPYFTINLEDVPTDIKKELGKLNDIELDILMNNLIEKIFRYSLRNEEYFNFQYFENEIQTQGLLKWELI